MYILSYIRSFARAHNCEHCELWFILSSISSKGCVYDNCKSHFPTSEIYGWCQCKLSLGAEMGNATESLMFHHKTFTMFAIRSYPPGYQNMCSICDDDEQQKNTHTIIHLIFIYLCIFLCVYVYMCLSSLPFLHR